MQHGGVGQLAAVSFCQNPKSQIALFHHRSTYILRGADAPVEIVAVELLGFVRWHSLIFRIFHIFVVEEIPEFIIRFGEEASFRNEGANHF